MPEMLEIDAFLEAARDLPTFDARTPAEFARGHIPQAHNLPLFLDEHRVVVGTAYKQEGRNPALLLGLDLVGPRMRELVEQVIAIAGEPADRTDPILVHCWRGGMRSGALAWLLEFYGYKVHTLRGGYKAFRRWVLDSFDKAYEVRILGGYTGSGKTLTLFELERMGEQILDLEGHAHHKGSAFGSLGLPPQPTCEHYENRLASALSLLDHSRRIWFEDESRMVGTCRIPQSLWDQMKTARVVAPIVPVEVRLERLVDAYGEADEGELIACFERIAKRLGGKHVALACAAVREGDLSEAARVGLHYYDRAYAYGLDKREGAAVDRFEVGAETPAELAALILAHEDEHDAVAPTQ